MNPLIQLKTTILPLLIAVVLGCFGLSPAAQSTLPRHRTEAIPASTPRKGKTPF